MNRAARLAFMFVLFLALDISVWLLLFNGVPMELWHFAALLGMNVLGAGPAVVLLCLWKE